MVDPPRGTLRAVAAAMTCCLLASCSPADTGAGRAQPGDRATATASSRAGGQQSAASSRSASGSAADGLPRAPAWGDVGTLARQIERAETTLRQRHAPPADQRWAGELQQLAARGLAAASPAFVTRLLDRLPPGAAAVTRSNVAAARLLRALTDPQSELPRWRIVAPLPQAELLALYRRAQRRTGVHWSYLAAIHLVETRMGRIRGTSSAGAQGPMQFLPSTWELYGAGGDIDDPADAIPAAARLLKAHGAPGDMANALWHYNPSDSYVGAVTEYARTMQRSARAYAGYWHWRVLYSHVRGTHVLPVGYPDQRARLLPGPGAPTGSRSGGQRAARGAVPPPWLGERTLPRTADGYGQVRRTPKVMRVRRWNAPDPIPALPGTGFRAVVADPAPRWVIARSTWRPGCPVRRTDLAWLRLTYWGFDAARHSGELLVHRSVADDLVEVFRRLYRARFPIESAAITTPEELDAPPTGDGNVTGAFVCRPVRGATSWSQHAYGLAVDVNPFQNPYRRGDLVLPELASAYLDRGWLRPGMITPDGPAARAFASIGWGWGGAWSSLKDYQHFSLTGR